MSMDHECGWCGLSIFKCVCGDNEDPAPTRFPPAEPTPTFNVEVRMGQMTLTRRGNGPYWITWSEQARRGEPWKVDARQITDEEAHGILQAPDPTLAAAELIAKGR